MKRIISIALIVALCLSIAPAFADSNVNVNINTGDNSTVQDINITNVDGCNNDVNVDTGCGTAGSPGGWCKPSKPGCSTIVIIDGVPGCVETPDHCGPCRRLDDPRHACLKDAARNAWEYLESQLKSIGWWYYSTHKFVWSSGTRVIYGRSGDNNHYNSRRAVTFYYKSDSSICKKSYLTVYIKGDEFIYLFSNDFLRISKCEKWKVDYAKYYPERITITGSYNNAYDAVDEFIDQLRALSGNEDVDEDYDCE